MPNPESSKLEQALNQFMRDFSEWYDAPKTNQLHKVGWQSYHNELVIICRDAEKVSYNHGHRDGLDLSNDIQKQEVESRERAAQIAVLERIKRLCETHDSIPAILEHIEVELQDNKEDSSR